MSKELKMLYSYEDYKNKKESSVLMDEIGENTARQLLLSMKFNRSEEEQRELDALAKENVYNEYLEKYTKMTCDLLDKYYELKNEHDNKLRKKIYKRIGVVYCQLQVLIESFNKEYNL
jgi:superfamily I DNA and/or RNA helicase